MRRHSSSASSTPRSRRSTCGTTRRPQQRPNERPPATPRCDRRQGRQHRGSRTEGMASRRLLRRAVHGHPRPEHRQRRAAGVLLGGVITDTIGWRWVLLINIPIGIAAAAGAAVVLSDDAARGRETQRIDVAGALTLTGGLIALVYGIVAAGYLGWTGLGA